MENQFELDLKFFHNSGDPKYKTSYLCILLNSYI